MTWTHPETKTGFAHAHIATVNMNQALSINPLVVFFPKPMNPDNTFLFQKNSEPVFFFLLM